MTDEPKKRLEASLSPAPRPGRTLKLGVRAAWNNLGLVCALSFTWFAVSTLPVSAAFAITRGAAPLFAALTVVCTYGLIGAPVFGGCCHVAAKILDHDETGYADLWLGVRLGYWKFVALAGIQTAVSLLLFSHLLFYSAMRGIVWLALLFLSIYLVAFWLANCLHHYPLLVAALHGHISRPEGGAPRISAVLRNGLLMVMSAPWHSVGLLAVLVPLGALLAVSGVGAALLGAGIIALVSTQATRDHLVRFGIVPADPDLDETAADEPWRLRDV